MNATLPCPPEPRRPDPGTTRERLGSQQRQIDGLRAELDAVRARLDFLCRLLSIDPADFGFPVAR